MSDGGNLQNHKSVDLFHLNDSTWSKGRDAPESFSSVSSHVFDGNLIIVAGRRGSSMSPSE